jgi:hypothetical protein
MRCLYWGVNRTHVNYFDHNEGMQASMSKFSSTTLTIIPSPTATHRSGPTLPWQRLIPTLPNPNLQELLWAYTVIKLCTTFLAINVVFSFPEAQFKPNFNRQPRCYSSKIFPLKGSHSPTEAAHVPNFIPNARSKDETCGTSVHQQDPLNKETKKQNAACPSKTSATESSYTRCQRRGTATVYEFMWVYCICVRILYCVGILYLYG